MWAQITLILQMWQTLNCNDFNNGSHMCISVLLEGVCTTNAETGSCSLQEWEEEEDEVIWGGVCVCACVRALSTCMCMWMWLACDRMYMHSASWTVGNLNSSSSLYQPPPVIEYEQPHRRGGDGRQATQSMYVRNPQHSVSDPRSARVDQSLGRDPPRQPERSNDVFSAFPRAEPTSQDARYRETMPPQYSDVNQVIWDSGGRGRWVIL